jgi:hypothetical protein
MTRSKDSSNPNFDTERISGIIDTLRIILQQRATLLEHADNALQRELIELLARWHVLWLTAGLQDSATPDFAKSLPLADAMYALWAHLERQIARCVAGSGSAFVEFADWARTHVPEYEFPDELLAGLHKNRLTRWPALRPSRSSAVWHRALQLLQPNTERS